MLLIYVYFDGFFLLSSFSHDRFFCLFFASLYTYQHRHPKAMYKALHYKNETYTSKEYQ